MPTRPSRWLLFFLFTLMWVGAGIPAWATSVPIMIGPHQQAINLGPHLRFTEDATGTLNVDDIRALPASAWTQNDDDALKRGYTRSHYWVTFDLQADQGLTPQSKYILDMDLSFLGYLDFFVVEGGQVTHVETGLARPYRQRPLPLETFALPLRFDAGETKTIFIHAYSEGALLLPLMLYGVDAFYEQRTNTNTLLGFFISLCLVLSAYNLFLYFTVREPSYLFYTITMLTMLWLQTSLRGLTVYYIWQDAAATFTYIEPTVMVWLGLIFTQLFASSFLKLKKWHPRLRVCFMVLIGFATLMTALTFVIPVYISLAIFNVTSGISIFSVVFTAVYTLRQGNKAARFFLLGWTFFLVSVLVTGVYLQGYLPSHLLTRHGMLIGGALEGILLSLALADRINFMQTQKLQAQRDAIAALENSHRLKDEFLLAITRELTAPLDDIANAVNHNREASSLDVITENNRHIEISVHHVLDAVDNLLCESELNAGRHVLQQQPYSLVAAPIATAPTTTNATISRHAPPLALVVEDNLVNQKVLQKMLERCGCRVQIANHGEEALAFCATEMPDIVFMDCQMPVMDGFEATRQLRKRFDNRQLPIVAVTANALPTDRLRCLEAGMNDYLAKPVKINDIEGALQRWLQQDNSHAA